jgi:GTP-binding protein HflX
MIYGNTDGIRNTILDSLESLYNRKLSKDSIATLDIIELISQISGKIDREISVAINRKGNICSVSIGDSSTVEIPILDIKERKLSGVRVIHTHPNGTSKLSALDISALLKLKLDCIIAIAVTDKGYSNTSLAFCDIEDDVLIPRIIDNMQVEELVEYNYLKEVNYIEKIITENEIKEDEKEKAVLVGCDSDESLDELEELAKACDVNVKYKVYQKRNKIDSAYYIGSGKAEEISLLCQAVRANMVIFDDELSGSQVRNLEEVLGVKVIDRTTLILEIFATRARSREAKIQVELAQLKYRLPRLMGLGTVLSRTGGGIGTRGPGEKKLETDRRHIRERLYDLQAELEKVKKIRETQRERRTKDNIPKVSLVGYTNAGKSTLRNKLCDIAVAKDASVKEKVFEADMLFATLDITTRAIVLPNNIDITITDTVGFVRKLPHDLVEAFKSTLEEVIYSDLLVHVVDSAADYAVEQIKAVEQVLAELKAEAIPSILVLNKVDKAAEGNINNIKEFIYSANKELYKEIIEISALKEINLDGLLQAIQNNIPNKLQEINLLIPYDEQATVAYLHRNSNILEEKYEEEGTLIRAMVDAEVYNKTVKFII